MITLKEVTIQNYWFVMLKESNNSKLLVCHKKNNNLKLLICHVNIYVRATWVHDKKNSRIYELIYELTLIQVHIKTVCLALKQQFTLMWFVTVNITFFQFSSHFQQIR